MLYAVPASGSEVALSGVDDGLMVVQVQRVPAVLHLERAAPPDDRGDEPGDDALGNRRPRGGEQRRPGMGAEVVARAARRGVVAVAVDGEVLESDRRQLSGP